MATPFERAVHDVIASLQPGEVLSYGEVAIEAGYPNAARAVGVYLRNSEGLPWWRVTGAGGRIISRCADDQARHLVEEGHDVVRRRVRPPR